ncbi:MULTISPECIES: hypothetical protein [Cupriavidus]
MPSPFALSLIQKRQAALLYHFTSLDYLQGLSTRIEGLLQYADYLLERRKVVEPFMYSQQWGARNTGANWSSTAYPALEDFRQGILKDIALRASEVFRKTEVGYCERMLNEYSMMWMSPDQEKSFKERFQEVAGYAQPIDEALIRSTPHDDFTLWETWRQYKALFPRLPRFRVHTEIVGHSGQVPPRTGVYVPADDPHGALQFAWIGTTPEGYRKGELTNCETFNDLGLEALAAVGRNGLWGDDVGLAAFLAKVWSRIPDANSVLSWVLDEKGVIETEPRLAASAIAQRAFTTHPCDWYFVELLEGEFEEDDSPDVTMTGQGVPPPQRAGEVCTTTGWWRSLAKRDSRRHFLRGDLFPDIPSDTTFGYVQWQWDDNQQSAAAAPVEPPRVADSHQPAPRAGLWLQAGNPLVRCRVAQNEPLPPMDGLSVRWEWTAQAPPGTRIASGQPCPCPGIWHCEDIPVGPRHFTHGTPLPQVQGRNVTWFLVRTP